MMLTLLTAFALANFNAHWGWWVAFGFLLTFEVIAGVLKGVYS